MSVKFVAEVASNHNRDLGRCLRFVETAAAVGCDAVKFQLFRVDELFVPEVLRRSGRHLRRREWELPVAFLPELAQAAHQRGLEFGCTPFYLEAVTELEPFVDFYKVASYELLWHELLAACAHTGKPVVLSTGMATLPEVRDALAVLAEPAPREITLLHAISLYPTPPERCNLSALETLRRLARTVEAGVPVHVGWSDHSVRPGVLARAVHRWGASLIEFHLDLDGEGAEFEDGHCWLPHQIAEAIEQIRLGLASDGSGEKAPVPEEKEERAWRADPADGLRPLRTTRQGWT